MFGRLNSTCVRKLPACPRCGTVGPRLITSRKYSVSTDQKLIDATTPFQELPKGYWTTTKNQRTFFEWIAKELNVTALDQWYNVSTIEIDKRGGQAMLNNCFKGSLYRAMRKLYPEHDWKPWLFQRLPAKFWDDDQHVADYLDWLSKQLGISKLDDWHLVSNNQIIGSLLKHRGPLSRILQQFYPNHPWKFTKNYASFGVGLGNAQQHLVKMMQSLFPSHELFVNYKHPQFEFAKSGVKMEFDVFVPSLNLACEYLGEQHYKYHFMFGSFSSVQQRDKEKRNACKEHGITYVAIPYWWDRNKGSLISTLKTIRPDLLPELPLTEPIPSRIPSKRSYKRVLQLAVTHRWNASEAPDNWWAIACPKGLRLWWDGEGSFLSNGNVVLDLKSNKKLEDINANLPSIPLDVIVSSSSMEPVELWNSFASNASTMDGKDLKFFILDAPAEDHLRYEERIKFIKERTKLNNQVTLLEGTQCKDQQHLDTITKETKKDMDNILLRHPNSHYYDPTSLQYIPLKNDKFEIGMVSQISPEIKCLLPSMKSVVISFNGDRNLLHVGSIVHVSQTEPAEIVQILPEQSWETILQTVYPYKLSYGTKRKEPQCRGCRKIIPKNSLRLEVSGLYSPTNLGPHPALYSICMNNKCLERAQNPALYTRSGIWIPKYGGTIRVPVDVKEPLPSVPNVNWVKT